jgi:hypothetical protein
MTNGYTKEKAQRAALGYIKTIEEHKNKITKNFNDMDLQNADIRDRYEEIIGEITKECNDLIAYIEGIRFN